MFLIQLPEVFANHEIINIFISNPPFSIQEGEPISTVVEITTGRIEGHVSANQDDARYQAIFRDLPINHPEVPPAYETVSLLVPQNDNILYNYTRPLFSGYWLLQVEVRAGGVDGELLRKWNQTINVQPSIPAIVQRQLELQIQQTEILARQADADEKNALYSGITAVVSPLAAVGAALLAGRLAYGAGHRLELMRQGSQERAEKEFGSRIRSLARHELEEYKRWLTMLLAESVNWEKEKKDQKTIHDRYVIESSPNWKELYEIYDFKGVWPRQYPHLPVEYRIRALPPLTMQRVDEAIARCLKFRESDLKRDVYDDGKISMQRFHYDKADAQEAIDKINLALSLLSG